MHAISRSVMAGKQDLLVYICGPIMYNIFVKSKKGARQRRLS